MTVILKDYVTTVTNQAMSNPNVQCQELLNTSNATTVVKPAMSRVSVPFNVVSTVIKLAMSQESVLNQERVDLVLPARTILVTSVVVQTMLPETVCKLTPSVTHVVDSVTFPGIVQMAQMRRFVITVTKLVTSLETAQFCNLPNQLRYY